MPSAALPVDMDIIDREDQSRFVAEEDGHEAQIVYEVRGDRLALVHTEVDEALGGRGMGGKLVTAAVERAERTGEILVPACPYARGWLRKHPEVADRVTIEWPPED